ncbi:MAG: hypothetical protein ABIO44_05600 [Saprospiraceae bacterium]
MNAKTIGIILIIAGAIMIFYTGFHYVTTEKVVDVGPIEINADKNHFVNWSPYLGVILLIGGLLMTFFKNKNS